MTRPLFALALLSLALLSWGCDSEMPPQITACDQLVLENGSLDTFLTFNNGLTCEFGPPADGERYACNRGTPFAICGMPSDITPVGCNCVDGEVDCFSRQDEADRANDMCGS